MGLVPRVRAAVADVRPRVRQMVEQGADLVGERMLGAAAGAVDPPDLARGPLRRQRVEHGQHRRRADPRAQQDDGARGLVEDERPGRRAELDDVAHPDPVVQVRADDAVALDPDAERVGAAQRVAADVLGVSQRHELPGQGTRAPDRRPPARTRTTARRRSPPPPTHPEAPERRRRGRGPRRRHPQHEEEQDRRAGHHHQHLQPRRPGVGAGAQRVRDRQDVDEDRRPVQRPPARGPDPVAHPPRQAEEDGEPAAENTEPDPHRIQRARERQQDVADRRPQEPVAEQDDPVHRDEHHPDERGVPVHRHEHSARAPAREAPGHREADADRQRDAQQGGDAGGAGGQPPGVLERIHDAAACGRARQADPKRGSSIGKTSGG